jgi:hypothetical protein
MDPWMIAALIAAAIGIGTLTSSAAAQANAALPRVTAFGVVDVPTPGLNGLWDLWVTGLNGRTGQAMMALIPGGAQDPNRIYLNMIYIPAALVQAQPTNVDWKYTFTPKGQTLPFTIVVPAAILQAYAAAPKNALRAQMQGSLAWMMAHPVQETLPTGGCSPQIVSQAIDDGSYLIFGKDSHGNTLSSSHLGSLQGGPFPSSGSASDMAQWMANNASLIAATIQEIVTAFDCQPNPDDQNSLNQLKAKIEAFAMKAGVSLATTIGGDIASALSSKGSDVPTDAGTDQSNDFTQQNSTGPTDSPSDVAPSDVATTDVSPTDQATDTSMA